MDSGGGGGLLRWRCGSGSGSGSESIGSGSGTDDVEVYRASEIHTRGCFFVIVVVSVVVDS